MTNSPRSAWGEQELDCRPFPDSSGAKAGVLTVSVSPYTSFSVWFFISVRLHFVVYLQTNT